MQPQDITYAELEEKKYFLGVLRRAMVDGITPATEGGLTMIFNRVFSTFYGMIQPRVIGEIQRVTINKNLGNGNSRIQNISLLKYPPARLVRRYGRCNAPNTSMLYAGHDPITIMSELKPEVGDLITVSTWENQNNTLINCFHVVGRQPTMNEVTNLNTWEVRQAFEQQVQGLPTHLRELFTLQMELMADAFSRVVLPEKNLDYLFSALFSGKVLEEGHPSEAIAYPSVQQDSSLDNIAIKASVFDRVYKLKEAQEMFVDGSPYGATRNMSGMSSQITATARSVQGDGQLDWRNSANSDLLERLKQEHGVNFG